MIPARYDADLAYSYYSDAYLVALFNMILLVVTISFLTRIIATIIVPPVTYISSLREATKAVLK